MKRQGKTKASPPLWTTIPVGIGNGLQLSALVIAIGLIFLAGHVRAAWSIRLALVVGGWLIVYHCSHAIAHWAVGRVMRIEFRAYGIRGTDHPESYPPGVRQLMSVLPFWVAVTRRGSLARATPMQRAAMFAAGETSTTVASLGAALFAKLNHAPGASGLLIFTAVWVAATTVITALIPKGDYARAIAALRAP